MGDSSGTGAAEDGNFAISARLLFNYRDDEESNPQQSDDRVKCRRSTAVPSEDVSVWRERNDGFQTNVRAHPHVCCLSADDGLPTAFQRR